MTEEDAIDYLTLIGELKAIQARLTWLADSAYSDMEGADADTFAISEAIFGHCDEASFELHQCTSAVHHLLMKTGLPIKIISAPSPGIAHTNADRRNDV